MHMCLSYKHPQNMQGVWIHIWTRGGKCSCGKYSQSEQNLLPVWVWTRGPSCFPDIPSSLCHSPMVIPEF